VHRGSLAASRRSRMERSLATCLFAEVETLLTRRCDSLAILICNIGYSHASVSRPLQLTPQNDQLSLERRILCFKPVLRLEWRGHTPSSMQYSNVFQQTCSRLAPFLPSAATTGSFPCSSGVGGLSSTSPTVISTMSLASWLGSRGRLRWPVIG
jgi:hypothetical protein